MTYTFHCDTCGQSRVEYNIRVEARDEPISCLEYVDGEDPCPGEMRRDAAATLQAGFGRGGSTAQHEDAVSFMERRYGHDPSFRPPTSGHAGEGRNRAGGGRSFPGDPRSSALSKWV